MPKHGAAYPEGIDHQSGDCVVTPGEHAHIEQRVVGDNDSGIELRVLDPAVVVGAVDVIGFLFVLAHRAEDRLEPIIQNVFDRRHLPQRVVLVVVGLKIENDSSQVSPVDTRVIAAHIGRAFQRISCGWESSRRRCPAFVGSLVFYRPQNVPRPGSV
jgi:hypothetical protein